MMCLFVAIEEKIAIEWNEMTWSQCFIIQLPNAFLRWLFHSVFSFFGMQWTGISRRGMLVLTFSGWRRVSHFYFWNLLVKQSKKLSASCQRNSFEGMSIRVVIYCVVECSHSSSDTVHYRSFSHYCNNLLKIEFVFIVLIEFNYRY